MSYNPCAECKSRYGHAFAPSLSVCKTCDYAVAVKERDAAMRDISTQRIDLMRRISNASDRYGYGEHGLIALMDEAGKTRLPDVTDAELAAFCKRHGITEGEDKQ